MKVVIPGGSGQLGQVLARAFHQKGHEVVVLSRTPASKPWRVVEVPDGAGPSPHPAPPPTRHTIHRDGESLGAAYVRITRV